MDNFHLELLAAGRSQPFSYDHDEREFHFGNQVKSIDEIPLYGTPHEAGEGMTAADIEVLLGTTPFVYNYTHPISFPLASDFFEHGWSDEIAHEVHEIMADVFFDHSDAFKASEHERLKSLRSFSSLRRTNPGDVILSTLGNCACLGPDYTSSHSRFLDAGIMEYTLHNTDRLDQKLSLMAGLGHVARRASEWLAVQGDTVHR